MTAPKQTWTVLETGHLSTDQADLAEFAAEVANGLGERPRTLPSRYFYDAEGSRLFQRITDLDEYYLTRVEHEILSRCSGDLVARTADRPLNLVDLGAGDGRKTRVVLEAFTKAGANVRYVPIDISRSAMEGLVGAMGGRFPGLNIEGLVAEYFRGLRWLAGQTSRRNLVMFLGSNIGNFSMPGARRFLRELRRTTNDGDLLLIGFDLKKDPSILIPAYSDAQGVTRAFNLNLLHRINRELDADIDVSKFAHYATWEPERGAMVSYLVSLERQQIRIGALREHYTLEAFEAIRTEQSTKYGVEDIAALASGCGFTDETHFTDEQGWFCDALWRVGA